MILMYLRKSRQDDPNETVEEVLAKHEHILQDYAFKTYHYRIPEEYIYREVVSGETIDDRPMIKQLFKRMELGDIEAVLVVEPSRLTRGDLIDCGTVTRNFMYTNTLVVTPMKTYDLNNKYDKKFFEMELTNGNFYLEYTKEILARGRYESSRSGNYISSVPPYGYDRVKIDKCWTLKINESEADYVRLAFQMYLDGYGADKIAIKLNSLGCRTRTGIVFKATAIRHMLSNEIYIGKIKWQSKKTVKVMENGEVVKKTVRCKEYEIFDGKHEAIIDEDTFNRVQEFKKIREPKLKVNYELSNPFASLMKCKKCGRAIGYNKYKDRPPRYYDTNKLYCDNMSTNCDVVDEAIINALKEHLENYKVKIELNTNDDAKYAQNALKSLEKELDKLNKRMEDICDYLEKGVYSVDMFVDRKSKIDSEIERVKSAIEAAKEELKNTPTKEYYQDKIVSLHECLDMLKDDSIPVKEKNNFLKKLIKVIWYEKDKGSIRVEVELY